MRPGYWFRMWRRTRRLRKELGREPTFGDVYADTLGYKVTDDTFQQAIAAAVFEVTGEQW